VSERTDRLKRAFAALDGGDPSVFRELFAEEAQWLGVPGSGVDGATPI
jgi:ketosteroid isomerase-like protein